MIGQELRAVIERYVAGQDSVDDLRRWRRGHAQQVAECGDAASEELYGTLAAVLGEFTIGYRSEESLRAELAKAHAQAALPVADKPVRV